MQNAFTEAMQSRSDKQLVDIVTLHRNDYQPEALQAAEAELLRRNLDVNTFYDSEQIDAITKPTAAPIVEQTLSTTHKIGIVALPLVMSVVISFIFTKLGPTLLTKFLNLPLIILMMYGIHYRLKEEGKTRMAEEFKVWSNYTIIFYIVAFMLLGLILFLTD